MPEPTGGPPLPAGLHRIPMAKGTILLLTTREFRLGLRRGKWWQRATAHARREAKAQRSATAPPGQPGAREATP